MVQVEEVYIARPEELAACCRYLAGTARFGLDTEFVGEDTYHPQLCLVQVSTDERLFLIDPQSAGPLDEFWRLVVDPGRTVIVHAGREEARLCQRFTGQPPGSLFDLQIAAGLVGMTYPIGHGSLVAKLLGIQISKGETLTEWRNRPLTAAQIQYAFDDVRYLLALWQRLDEELRSLDRTEWAREEFRRLALSGQPAEAATNEKWRKLRGAGSLDRRRLSVFKDLYEWREERALRGNRPARSICRDDLLVELARRNPKKPRDLQVIRGLPRRDLDEIFEVIQKARAHPPEQWPELTDREQDPPQLMMVSNVLTAVLGDISARKRLASNLVASNSDLRALVRARRDGRAAIELNSSLLTQGWRAAHILPELLAVLDGKRSVRIGDLKADAPLAYGDDEQR